MMSGPPFDKLKYDADAHEYVQTLVHRGHELQVCFQAEDANDLSLLLPTAASFWKARASWFRKFREFAASELLDALNATLDDGEGRHREKSAAQVLKLLPAPFLIRFRPDDDDPNQVVFELNGGDDDELLDDICFEAFGTIDDGFSDGDIVSLS